MKLVSLFKVLISRGASSLGLIFLTYMINNVYGVTYLGDFSIVFSALGVGVMLSRFGTENLIIKKGSYLFFRSDKFGFESLIKSSILIIATLSSLIAILSYYLIVSEFSVFHGVNRGYAIILLMYIVPFSLSGVLSSVAKATKRTWHYPFFELGFPAFIVSLVVWFANLFDIKLEFELFLHLYAVVNLVILILGFIYNIYILNGLSQCDEIVKDENYFPLKTTVTFLALSIFAYASTNGLPFIMSYYFDNETVGQFATAFRLSITVSLIITIVNSTFVPDFAINFKEKNTLKLKESVRKSSLYLVVLCIPIIMFIFYFSSELVSLFGVVDDNGELKEILWVLLFGQLINVITGSVTPLMNMTGLHGYNLLITVLSSILCVTMVHFFSSQHYLMGVAISVSFYWGLKNALSAVCLYFKFGLNILSLLNKEGR